MRHGQRERDNFWRSGELRRYLRLLRDAERAHAEKMQLVRNRIKGGFYLTDEVARATSATMLSPTQRRNPFRAS